MGSIAQVCAYISRFRLIVGAPTANWLANSSVVNPGAIYRCIIGKNPNRTCEQLQLGELDLGSGASEPPSRCAICGLHGKTSPGKTHVGCNLVKANDFHS